MDETHINRREFVKGAALAGLGGRLLAHEAPVIAALLPEPAPRPAATRPVVVASANGARRPGGGEGRA
jgi:hypothetical protein